MQQQGKGGNKKLVFVGHDYTTRGGRKNRFRRAISAMLKSLNYNPVYADKKRLHITVITDIKEKIKKSDFCIFDLTGYKEKKKLGKNLNVILEIGVSIGLNRHAFVAYKEGCIDFTKELSDLLGDYRYPYKTYTGLVKELRETIRSLARL